MFSLTVFALLSSSYLISCTPLIQAETSDTYVESELDGPNICKKVENYNVDIITTELQSYQVRTSTWCLSVPPRCSAYSFKERVVNKTQTLTKSRIVKDCCEGYKRAGNACMPDCTPKCQHGVCLAPNKCKCDHSYGGPACDIICRCKNNSSCDPDTGHCICSPGWSGEDCSKPCDEGSYGMGCKEKCPVIIHGNKSCHHITGEIICRDGYIGLTCEHPCPTSYYGSGCTKICNCANSGECNHITGACQCMPGWYGLSCNASCEEGYFGTNCIQKCRCLHEAKCRKNDGHCICQPGWMGQRCEEVCPDGFYGPHCMLPCSCPSPNFVCHAAQGCICRVGFTGENCDVPTAEQRIQEANLHSGRAGLAWGLTLAILFVAVIIAVIFYYRRRVSNLKTEIAHVQYTSDPTRGWPDRHNFDNPVYGLPNGDEQHLLNNLKPKINNLNRSGSELYTDDSNASSNGKAGFYSINYNHDMIAKNLNADLTNPNVYNSLEGLKEEHVYDEIKHKEGLKDPVKNYKKILFPDDEYDHLDYSRPSTSQKAHYHRMNDTMLNINRDEEKLSNLKTMEVLLKKCEVDKNDDTVKDVDDNDDNNNKDNNNAACSLSICDNNVSADSKEIVTQSSEVNN
ncbi:protein draper isoform X4 [Glossina fuscipes]|uniref:Protein draper isoform X4 n=1 Tax=Glossina fuscipes TaxID=7396 RepID=A0A9C5Z4Y9_9MUSC|nr:protein draper isoform X4 [Glossina fuscipes]